MARKIVFLGGTVGRNNWRLGLIERLVGRGVDPEALFNPVVSDWNEAAQKREDEAKASAEVSFFYLGNPREDEQRVAHSIYSLIQVVDSAYRVDTTTRILFDTGFLDPHSAKAIRKIAKDIGVRFPGVVLGSWGEFVHEIARLWSERRDMLTFLGGTSGNNSWRKRLLSDLRARGVSTDRFFDPVVAVGTWNAGVQYLEDQMRRACDHEVFFVGNPMEERVRTSQVSPYSMVEAYMALYEDSHRASIVFDYSEFAGHALDSMRKFETDVRRRFPTATVFSTLAESEDWLAERLK